MVERPRVLTITTLVAALPACLTVIGWAHRTDPLSSVFFDAISISIKANAAAGILFLCLALLTLLVTKKVATAPGWRLPSGRETACILALAPFLLGLATFIEYALHLNLGTDQWMFRERMASFFEFPGRLAPVTAADLMAASVMIWSFAYRGFGRCTRVSFFFVFITAYQSLLGYLFNLSYVFGNHWYNQMAASTSLSLIIMSAGFAISCQTRVDWRRAGAAIVVPILTNAALMLLQSYAWDDTAAQQFIRLATDTGLFALAASRKDK